MMKVTEVVAALIWQDDKFMICQRLAHKASPAGVRWRQGRAGRNER